MSSLNNEKPYENKVSESQFNGYFVPSHSAKLIRESIENNTAPFLPDSSGVIKAKPIFNGNKGFCLTAKDLIPLQIIQGENSNVVVTFNTVNKAGIKIKEGEKGFFYNYQKEDKSVGVSQYFFPEQTENPEKIKEFVNPRIAKGIKLLTPDKIVEIKSSEPDQYLGAYLAACKTGATVKVSPEIAEQFKQNVMPILKNQTSIHKNKEMDSLSDLMFKSERNAIDITTSMQKEKGQQQAKSQEQQKPQKKQHKEVERDFS